MVSSTFFSDFIATTLGVLFAFVLDRIVNHFAERKNELENNDKLVEMLTLILRSINNNKDQLTSFLNSSNSNLIKVSFQIDLVVWDTLKKDLTLLLKDTKLKYDISQYFMNMGYILKLYDVYFDFSEKKNNLSEDADYRFYDNMLDVIKNGNLKTWLPELLVESDELISSLTKVINKI